jgi:hypothetical protein
MKIVPETLAEIALDGRVRPSGAIDAARSSYTVRVGNSLLALSPDLKELGRWPAELPRHRGSHAACPATGLALISGPEDVRLIDQTGRVRWHHPHPPWTGAFESGCTWFDAAGQPHAVVPDASYGHCLVARFDLDSGQLLAASPIPARPAGIEVIHHPDGWTGLSEGEGQDAVQAWWVRSASTPSGQTSIDILGHLKSWIFADVDPAGSKIITTPHLGDGPILVRSFPSLEIVRVIQPAEGQSWTEMAFFAGDLIVAGLQQQDGFVAISQRGRIMDLDQADALYLWPANEGSWLAFTETTIRRCRMTGSEEEIVAQSRDQEIPGQMSLW